MSKQGFIVLVIGKMGCGKSPLIKSMVERNNLKRLVADVRKEYPITYSRHFINTEEQYYSFMNEAENAINTNIIIEEATAFFNGYNQRRLMKFVTGIEHNHCIGYFAFHSVHKVPDTLLDLARFICLFKTGETRKTILKHEERFAPYLDDLKNHNNVYKGKWTKEYVKIDTRSQRWDAE